MGGWTKQDSPVLITVPIVAEPALIAAAFPVAIERPLATRRKWGRAVVGAYPASGFTAFALTLALTFPRTKVVFTFTLTVPVTVVAVKVAVSPGWGGGARAADAVRSRWPERTAARGAGGPRAVLVWASKRRRGRRRGARIDADGAGAGAHVVSFPHGRVLGLRGARCWHSD
jgi:hypothetical protein